MNELSIQEKASRYDEAIKRIEDIKTGKCETTFMFTEGLFEYIFPKHAESKDEKIRKEILQSIRDNMAVIHKDECIAWLEKQGKNNMGISEATKQKLKDYLNEALEKETPESWNEFLEGQGEQKPTKNIVETWKDMRLEVYQQASGNRHEPNYSDDTTKIFSLNDIDEIIEKMSEQNPADKAEPKFHEGEWMCENEPNNYARFIQILEIVNIQGKERYRVSRDIHNDEDIVEFGFVEKYYHRFDIQDAKDGDVLYSLDSKQPFIYKERPQYSQAIGYCCINKFGEFAVWNTSKCVIYTDKYIPATKEQRDLLFQKMKEEGYTWNAEKKDLKKIEKKPTWSEEDDKMCQETIDWFEKKCFPYALESENPARESIKWLKTLKERVQPKTKQEWSEEDENAIGMAIIALDDLYDEDLPDTTYGGYNLPFNKAAERLKSIKARHTWKPSDEQINALDNARHSNPFNIHILDTLFHELKKL